MQTSISREDVLTRLRSTHTDAEVHLRLQEVNCDLEEFATILCHAIKTDEFSVHTLLPGMSSASVFLVTGSGLPKVFKFGDNDKITREFDSFNRGVLDFMPAKIRPGVPQYCPGITSFAALAYEWTGAVHEVVTLSDALNDTVYEEKQIRELINELAIAMWEYHDPQKVTGLPQFEYGDKLSQIEAALESVRVQRPQVEQLLQCVNNRHSFSSLRLKKTTRGRCHGDLNARNITVAPNSGRAAPMVIDFYLSGQSACPARDWAKLEREILFNALLPTAEPEEYAAALLKLSRRLEEDHSMPATGPASAVHCHAAISEIRSSYYEHAGRIATDPKIEYLYYLLYWKLEYLYWHDFSRAPLVRKLAIIDSALNTFDALERILTPPLMAHAKSHFGIIDAIALIIALAIGVLTFYRLAEMPYPYLATNVNPDSIESQGQALFSQYYGENGPLTTTFDVPTDWTFRAFEHYLPLDTWPSILPSQALWRVTGENGGSTFTAAFHRDGSLMFLMTSRPPPLSTSSDSPLSAITLQGIADTYAERIFSIPLASLSRLPTIHFKDHSPPIITPLAYRDGMFIANPETSVFEFQDTSQPPSNHHLDIILSDYGGLIAAIDNDPPFDRLHKALSDISAKTAPDLVLNPKHATTYRQGVFMALLLFCAVPYLIWNLPSRGGRLTVAVLVLVDVLIQFPYDLSGFIDGTMQQQAAMSDVVPSAAYAFYYAGQLVLSCLVMKVAYECVRRLFSGESIVLAQSRSFIESTQRLGLSALRGAFVGTILGAGMSLMSSYVGVQTDISVWMLSSFSLTRGEIETAPWWSALSAPESALLLIVFACSLSWMCFRHHRRLAALGAVALLTLCNIAVYTSLISEGSFGDARIRYAISAIAGLAYLAVFLRYGMPALATMLVAIATWRVYLPINILFDSDLGQRVNIAKCLLPIVACVAVGCLLCWWSHLRLMPAQIKRSLSLPGS